MRRVFTIGLVSPERYARMVQSRPILERAIVMFEDIVRPNQHWKRDMGMDRRKTTLSESAFEVLSVMHDGDTIEDNARIEHSGKAGSGPSASDKCVMGSGWD